MTSAVVIGGGVSGLVAAWRLALLGRAVEVFEATDDFGGAVCPVSYTHLTLPTNREV